VSHPVLPDPLDIHLQQLPKGGVGAEIGVYRGEFGPDLLRVTEARELHLIDSWWTLAETYDDQWYGTKDTREAYELTRRTVRLAPGRARRLRPVVGLASLALTPTMLDPSPRHLGVLGYATGVGIRAEIGRHPALIPRM
jgi:hypothetical protein